MDDDRNDPRYAKEEDIKKGFEDTERVWDVIRSLYGPTIIQPKGAPGKDKKPPCQLADIQAFVGIEVGNDENEVAVENVLKHALNPASTDPDRDGLNRRLRQLRPGRQRPRRGSKVQ